MRGAIAAMAMTGLRSLMVNVGIVDETPPRAMLRRTAGLLFRLAPRRRRRVAIELVHWGYGAAGGAAFRLLPETLRMRACPVPFTA